MFESGRYGKAITLVAVAVVAACSSNSGREQAEDELSLAKKAAVFEYDMKKRFTLDGQALCKLKRPTEQRPFTAYNMPDNAYMTGMYLGALALKYGATKDPAVKEETSRVLGALDLLCTVSGRKGLLARAAWPVDTPFDDDGNWRRSEDGRHMWRGDVSCDQVDGVMFGYALAYDLVADAEERAVIARNVAAICDHILENDLRIVGFDGRPTRWGSYYPGYVRTVENMNALLFLQLFKVAVHVTGEARFQEAYHRFALEEGYAETAVTARRQRDPLVGGAVNHSDDVLLFLAYYPLLGYERDPALRDLYEASLRRSWHGDGTTPGVRPEANPLYEFVARSRLGDEVEDTMGVVTLSQFPLDMKWNRDTIRSYETRFDFVFDPTPKSPAEFPGKAVPMDRRGKSWSAWVMDPYRSRGDRAADSAMEYNGHDYLLAYWLGRYHGYIDPEQ